MEERHAFMLRWRVQEESLSELCRCFDVSRQTAYKWIARYQQSGLLGLADRSRAPVHHPNQVSDDIQDSILHVRTSHPLWGPKKIRAWLNREHPDTLWPVESTIGELLKRHGLTHSRRRSHKTPVYTDPFVHCTDVNHVWSADFKGWFRTGDGHRCDPLTLTDNYSRFLLRCQAVRHTDHVHVKAVLEAAFREYGLPNALRTDNGPPFATTTVGGLSRISIWLYKLGIIPERIAPGQPAQNGRHERMHRTLKAGTATPPRATLRAQQRAFDSFRHEYNTQRPHEAINQQPPASLFRASSRSYPSRLPEIVYPDYFLTRTVHAQGDIRWKSRQIYLSDTLAGELIGMDQTDTDRWTIWFGPIKLAQLDTRTLCIVHYPRRWRHLKQR